MEKERLEYLLDKFKKKTLTDSELQEWIVICQQEDDEATLVVLSGVMQEYKGENEELPAIDIQSFISEIVSVDKPGAILKPVPQEQEDIKVVKPLYKQWWAAASVLFLLGLGAYLWNNVQSRSGQPGLIPSATDGKSIPGGSNGAVLTLADGSRIVLDSLGNGLVAAEAGTIITLKDNQLQYETNSKPASNAVFNTMTTPKGRQFQLVLPDGTKVWLNAASSLRYPTRFAGNERRVVIEGEAYFEVVKNKQKPFIVQTSTDRIIVTGTQFNVNAYQDEPFVKTSLVEGAVLVNNKLLKPGQACFNNNIIKTNTDQDIAWKNGYFNFNNLDLPTMMRQLERWYNIETQFEGNVQQISFRGKMDRGLDLSDILFFFTESKIRYKLEGRKLTVYGN